MNRKTPHGYLIDLLERMDRIEAYSRQGRLVFLESELIQDAILRNFEVMGEIVKRMDKGFTDAHPTVPWRRMAGFRDILIHNYEGVAMEVVWEVIERDLPNLRSALTAILDTLSPST
jgi:uncharacterized protein with HEPN domain